MFTSASCMYSINKPARVITPQYACQERHRFLVGSCSLRESNEISLLEYDEDNNDFRLVGIYSHPNAVWAMDSCAHNRQLIVTSEQHKTGLQSVTVYKMPPEADDLARSPSSDEPADVSAPQDMEVSARLLHNKSSQVVSAVKWHRTNDSILTLDANDMTLWSVSGASTQNAGTFKLPHKDALCPTDRIPGSLAWDPHNASSAGLAAYRSVYTVDTRTMSAGTSIAQAHDGAVRSIDFNPNKPMMVITAGDDRKVKIWDLRFNDPRRPVRSLAGHSHWVWTAKYNPFHDQLIASGGSDNVVNLWRIASCSSAPWIEDAYAVNMASLSADGSADSEEPARGRVNNMKSRLGKDSFEDDGAADAPLDNNSGRSGSMDTSDELHYARTNIMALAGTSSRGGAGMDQTTGTKIVSDPPDIKVKAIDEHEDSVYDIAWSACDAWMFCSLSFEGRVVLNHVPSTEKYKILL